MSHDVQGVQGSRVTNTSMAAPAPAASAATVPATTAPLEASAAPATAAVTPTTAAAATPATAAAPSPPAAAAAGLLLPLLLLWALLLLRPLLLLAGPLLLLLRLILVLVVVAALVIGCCITALVILVIRQLIRPHLHIPLAALAAAAALLVAAAAATLFLAAICCRLLLLAPLLLLPLGRWGARFLLRRCLALLGWQQAALRHCIIVAICCPARAQRHLVSQPQLQALPRAVLQAARILLDGRLLGGILLGQEVGHLGQVLGGEVHLAQEGGWAATRGVSAGEDTRRRLKAHAVPSNKQGLPSAQLPRAAVREAHLAGATDASTPGRAGGPPTRCCAPQPPPGPWQPSCGEQNRSHGGGQVEVGGSWLGRGSMAAGVVGPSACLIRPHATMHTPPAAHLNRSTGLVFMNLRSWEVVRKASSGKAMWQPQQPRCSASSSITCGVGGEGRGG